MADVEEPQFVSLQARIAALNQQGMGNKPGSGNSATFGKRPPPPLPTSSSANAGTRPAAPTRNQTVNNPPIASHGSSVVKQANNLPIGKYGAAILPPPPVDRDQPRSSNQLPSKSPSLPSRNAPPPLPGRKASQPSLPPRHGSSQAVTRRGSNASTLSHSSTVSGLSLTQTGSSMTSAASTTDGQRKLPPVLGDAKLPPLPPSRREREEREKERAKEAKIPLVTVKSAPTIPIRQPPVVERDLVPSLPQRPRLPSRPASSNNLRQEEAPPAQPPRRLPPPSSATRSPLTMGFGNKTSDTPPPLPGARPAPSPTRPAGPAVQELTAGTFDRAIAGKFALVDFYAPYCKYCVEMEPDWKQLGEAYAFAQDRMVIAKVDVDAHKTFLSRYSILGYPTILYFDGRSDVPEPYPYSRTLDGFTSFLEEKTGILVSEGANAPKSNGAPPPINMSSKPSKSQVNAVQSRPAPKATPSRAPTGPPKFGCMLCRDFSGPDGVAAQYPRETLPRTHDIEGYLADVLCSPFKSATDKARAIYTWCHHNLAYDCVAFFGNKVKHVEPKDNIASGLAVCSGYAGVVSAIALKAGLEAVVIGGHGKGYGYTPTGPNDPVPRFSTDHAWNAVRIDGGEWKLIDACWGAGNVSGQTFTKAFKPNFFTMSNEEFGLSHFSEDSSHFYRADGRTVAWEDYILAESVKLFGTPAVEHGILPSSILPANKSISLARPNETIRFQFSKVCEHWDPVKNGPGRPYPLILKIGGLDGRKDDFVPLDSDGYWWWCDVHAKDLGARGGKVSLFAVTEVDGRDARGMSKNQYLQAKGKKAMKFGGVAEWALV